MGGLTLSGKQLPADESSIYVLKQSDALLWSHGEQVVEPVVRQTAVTQAHQADTVAQLSCQGRAEPHTHTLTHAHTHTHTSTTTKTQNTHTHPNTHTHTHTLTQTHTHTPKPKGKDKLSHVLHSQLALRYSNPCTLYTHLFLSHSLSLCSVLPLSFSETLSLTHSHTHTHRHTQPRHNH